MPENQRSSKRALLRVRALLSANDGSTGIAKTHDVSTGGVSVLTDHPLQIKHRLKVTFEANLHGKNRTVEGLAQVQWSMLSNDQFKSGLEFISLTPGSLDVIKALVALAP